jgi:hypothetical protein
MSRPPKKSLLPAAPVNFLLGCSDADLGSYMLQRLSSVANLRGQILELMDKMIEETSASALAQWFRTQDRVALKNAIETPGETIQRIVAQAKEGIRDGQRNDEELIPRTPLPPGAAHLAAALRYAERNIAEGKCAVCPQPLARNSIRYCTRHLEIARLRKPPKNAKGSLPGSVDWLYGDGVFESAHGKAPSQIAALKKANEQRAKQHRSIPAEKALYESVAKQLEMSPEHVRAVALGQRRSKGVLAAIDDAMDNALAGVKPSVEANEKRKGSRSQSQRKNKALLTILKGEKHEVGG